MSRKGGGGHFVAFRRGGGENQLLPVKDKQKADDLLLSGKNDGSGAVKAKMEVILRVWLECLHFGGGGR